MSENKLNHEETLFEAALEKPSAAERAAFLDDACRGNPALRARLDVLLEGHFQAAGFLQQVPGGEARPAALAPTVLVPAEPPLPTIGRYKLLQKIGEGGCGTVYMAEQLEPVRRRVALKVVKLGMDTRDVIARFEAERQALAVMDHPNIAKVFDAGATEAGRPYFVMELVRGVKISQFCDERQLSLRERLDLFIQVCQAIQHAHQKGIIHRDIKPSNILVTMNDGVPVPKVIDFGIAKATAGNLTERTLFTMLDQFIGTPAYMSPEQAEVRGVDIDTRSDIYSLGVVLYELLTGRTPFDSKALLERGIEELILTLRDVEPPRPSTRLSTLAPADLQTLARAQKCDSPKLVHLLKGDLDWIVMKCLEKDRTRRYETANGLAMDLQRHLTNEPIVARPPSTAYRFQKAWQRNKLAFTAAAAVALVLVAGIGVSTWQAVEANLARRGEIKARLDEAKARKQAEWNEQAALSNAAAATVQRLKAEAAAQRMQMQTAERYLTDGDALRGVALLANVLSQNPSNQLAGQRLASALLHRPFSVPSLIVPGAGQHGEFSRDGRWIVSGSAGGIAQVWDARSGQPVGAPMTHAGQVQMVRFSLDAKKVVTGSDDNTARIWEAGTGRPVSEPLVHPGPVGSIDFSPDGTQVATASHSGSKDLLQFWDLGSGKPMRAAISPGAYVHSIRYSPDGRLIAVGQGNNRASLWNVASGELAVPPLHWHKGPVTSVAFSPDGRWLATASWDGKARIWSVETGQPAGTSLNHDWVVLSAEFSPDGKTILTASQDSTARLWSVATTSPMGAGLRHEGRVHAAHFSPDGRHIVTISNDETARLWDANTAAPVTEPMRHGSPVTSADFNSDGTLIATTSKDGTLWVWPVQAHGGPRLVLPQNGVHRVCVSPDGRRIASAGAGSAVAVWDAQSGAAIGPGIVHPFSGDKVYPSSIDDLQFSLDGKRLVTASKDKTARVWEVETGSPVTPPLQHEHWVFAARFSPDGQRIATASHDGTARVWDAATGQPIGQPCLHQGWIMTAEFSPDGQRLVTASEDFTARIWDAATGKALGDPLRHQGRVYTARFSEDGSRVITGSEDRTARVWDAASGRPIGEPLRHSAAVRSVAFSPDGHWALSSGEDGHARVWDAQTGRPVSPPLALGAWGHARFSPNGKDVLTSSAKTRLWDAQSGTPLTEVIKGGGSGHGAAQFGPDGTWFVVSGSLGAKVYEVPKVVTPVPEWLPRLAEAVAGGRLVQGQETIEPVPLEVWNRLVRDMGQTTSTNATYGWARSLLPSSDPVPGVLQEVTERRRKAIASAEGVLKAAAFRTQGRQFCQEGKFAEAAAAYREALRLNHQVLGADAYSLMRIAVLFAYVGDAEGYHQIYRQMLASLSAKPALNAVEQTAKTGLLLPEVTRDVNRCATWADQLVVGTEAHPGYPWFVLCKALADYRRGHHAAAIAMLSAKSKQETRSRLDVTALAILTMARHQLGAVEEAKASLAEARAILAGQMPDPAKGQPLSDDWHDWLLALTLVREAEAMLAAKADGAPSGQTRGP